LQEKARLYAQKQIQEYWVLDINGKQLWIHRDPSNGQYRTINQVATGTIAPLALPQMAIEVSQLLP
jgi:Uma2 family endonuclease